MDAIDKIQQWRRALSARLVRGVLPGGSVTGQRLPSTGIHRILICRSIRTLGNSLTLTPLLTELARVYPGAEVDMVCRSKIARDLFGGFSSVRDLWLLPQHMPGHPLATWLAFHRMRRKAYDLVIDPDPLSQSGRLMMAMAHARCTLGYVGGRKHGAVTHGVAVPDAVRHKAVLPVYLLRAARGDDPMATAFPAPHLPLTADELETGWHAVERLLARAGQAPRGAGPRIGVFANATGPKQLALAWWRRFLPTLVAGVPGARIIELVPASAHSMLADAYPSYFSSDIRRLAAVIANLDGCVASDSGVMHLAWATGTPTLGVFSVTDPAQWGPFGGGSSAIHVAGHSAEEAGTMAAEWWQHHAPRAAAGEPAPAAMPSVPG